jgi:hypothetical protein
MALTLAAKIPSPQHDSGLLSNLVAAEASSNKTCVIFISMCLAHLGARKSGCAIAAPVDADEIPGIVGAAAAIVFRDFGLGAAYRPPRCRVAINATTKDSLKNA